MNKTSGIYIIQNTKNNKIYIGSTKNFCHRWQEHVCDLNKNRHGNPHLQSSWNKYGKNNFIFKVIKHCNIKELIIYEQFYLDNHFGKKCYNMCPVAGTTLGRKMSKKNQTKNVNPDARKYI